MDDVAQKIIKHFGEVFKSNIKEQTADEFTALLDQLSKESVEWLQ